MAIVLIAVLLDLLFYAWTQRPPITHQDLDRPLCQRYSALIWAFAALVLCSLASIWLPELQAYPKAWEISSGQFFDTVIDYITIEYYSTIETFSTFMYLRILNPVRDGLLALPWSVALALLALAGWRAQGGRLAVLLVGLAAVILITGFWEKSMITVYLIGVSVTLAMLIGLPLGVLGAMNERSSAMLRLLCAFRNIRPLIPATSGHPYRGIRPPLTRCFEAHVFSVS